MDLSTSTVLVTGANRGLGRELSRELLARGATVYAGARNPDLVDLPGAKPIALDITDPLGGRGRRGHRRCHRPRQQRGHIHRQRPADG
ncbi:hypothetical protein GCM10025734_08480 [Kitasatospora paranensis]